MSDWRTAVHYRNRAAMLRAIADETENDDHKLALCRVAAYYDKMAIVLERDAENPAD